MRGVAQIVCTRLATSSALPEQVIAERGVVTILVINTDVSEGLAGEQQDLADLGEYCDVALANSLLVTTCA